MNLTTATAPFTDEQVGRLVAWQLSPFVHGFTCGNREDHAWRMADYGGLTPTKDGWVCEEPGCGFTQDWCYDMMLEPIPASPCDPGSQP